MNKFYSCVRWEHGSGTRSRGSIARTIVGEGRGSNSRSGPTGHASKGVGSADAPDNVTDVCSTYMCCPPYITGPDPGISARLMHVECMTHLHLTTKGEIHTDFRKCHLAQLEKSVSAVLHGESSKRLATPRNTKNKKHLQSTQSAQPTNLTDQAPNTTERTARETHNTN